MKLPFRPTWEKAAAQPGAFGPFYYICNKDVNKEWRKTGFDALNEGRKKALRFRWLTDELNNGGLEQYFWNFPGGFTAETIQDLREIGAVEAADVLAKAAAKLFHGVEPPKDTAHRRHLIEQHFGTRPFNDDDDHERVSVLKDKENLEIETDELDALQCSAAAAMFRWMQMNRGYFSRVRE